MEWLQAFMIAGSTVGACWYMHREHKTDTKNIAEAFNKESRDFHGRLCTLEEKYMQMLQKMWEDKK